MSELSKAIRETMERIAKSKPDPSTKLVYDKGRRTIIEIQVDATANNPLKIYDEDADFNCGSEG